MKHLGVYWHLIMTILIGGCLSCPMSASEWTLGTCRNPSSSETSWTSCARPKLGVEVMAGKEMSSIRYSDIYLATYWLPKVSAHAQWSLSDIQGKETVVTELQKNLDFYFLQWGNIAEDRLRLRGGKIDLPFGVHSPIWMRHLEDIFLDQAFYLQGKMGAQIDYDTFVSSQYQVGIAQQNSEPLSGQGAMFSLRGMFDLTAVENFRSVVSYARIPGESHKVGFGMISTTRSQDYTSLEWIKIYYEDKAIRPRQLFVMSYDSKKRSKQSWHLGFVSDQGRHRVGVVGSNMHLQSHGLWRVGLGYFSSWDDKSQRFWFFTYGLELRF